MLSRADLIKRFRENKPTSREERIKDNNKIQLIFDNDDSYNSNTKVESTDGNISNDHDDHVPRSLLVGPSTLPSKPHDNLRNIRQTTNNYMINENNRSIDSYVDSIFKDRKLGETNNVDDLIEKEIQQLKREVEDKDRQITAKLNLSSYDNKYNNKNKNSNEVRFTLSNEYNDSHLSLSPKSYRMMNNRDKERKKNEYSNIDMLRMSNNEDSLLDSTEFLRKYRDKGSSNNKNNFDYAISSGLHT